MWLMTKYGFFSVVCAWKDGGKGLDSNKVMVRARCRNHLVRLLYRFSHLFPKSVKVIRSEGTDYPYRIIVKKSVWIACQLELTKEIDYGNFKQEVSEEFLHEGRDIYYDRYMRFLHKVWYEGFSFELQRK